MNAKISIQVEKTAAGYSAYSPEIEGSQVQGESVESLVDALKPILSHYLNTQDNPTQIKTNQPIWQIAQEITSDMTEAEIQQLPADGAEQHDHYIYGIGGFKTLAFECCYLPAHYQGQPGQPESA